MNDVIMTKTETVEGRLRRAIGESGASLLSISEGAGLSYASVWNFARGKQGLGLKSAEKLARHLEWDLELTPRRSRRRN